MNFESYSEKIKELSSLFENESLLALYYGFDINLPRTLINHLIQRGWWHVLFLGYNEGRNVQYGLRILANQGIEKWPVVALFQGQHAGSYSPDLSSFFKIVNVETLLESADFFNDLKDDWQPFEDLEPKLKSYFGWEDSFIWLKNYVLDVNKNFPKADLNWKSERWAKIIQELDSTSQYSNLQKLIKNTLEDDSHIPDIDLNNFGIWKNWAANLVAARMVINENLFPHDVSEKILWNGFVQPTGYDPCTISFSHLPNRYYDPYMEVFEIANILGASYFKPSTEIRTNPLFPAVDKILKLGGGGYKGEEHIQGAKQFISQNKYEDAWNALVSAAYWSGKNSDQTSEEALNLAIELTASDPKSDAHQALLYNREILKG